MGVTTTNLLDSANQVLVTRRIGSDGSTNVLNQATYDNAGMLTAQSNALGGSTAYSETFDGNGQLIRTTTAPDGGTRIETYFKDGQLAKVTGTAAQPARYEYGIESSGGRRGPSVRQRDQAQ